MKTVAWCVVSAAFAVLITVLVCRWRTPKVKRVWMTYSEKYMDATIGRSKDYEKVDTDRNLYGEEQLQNMIAPTKDACSLRMMKSMLTIELRS